MAKASKILFIILIILGIATMFFFAYEPLTKLIQLGNQTQTDIQSNLPSLAEKPIPNKLQPISKFLFRIDSSNNMESNLSVLLISTIILITLLISFTNMFRLFSPFSEISSFAISLTMTFLISVTGIIKNRIVSFVEIMGYLGNLSFLGVIGIIIGLFILIGIFNYFVDKKEDKEDLEEATEEGREAAISGSFWKSFGKKLADATIEMK